MKKQIVFTVFAAACAAQARTIQMPPACTTPDGMCVDPKGRLVIAARAHEVLGEGFNASGINLKDG